jgi:NADH dehydrogenase
MKPKNCLIFGASGQIGRNLIRKLTKNNYKVTAVTRNYHQKAYVLKTQANPGYIDIIECNIFEESKIRDLVKRADICINLIGILFEKGKINTFENIHEKFPIFLSNLCNEYNVEHFIHLSALGIEQAIDSLYAKSKLNGEEFIRKNFKVATILKPSVVYSVDDNFTTNFMSILNILPIFPLYYNGETKFMPIYCSDLTEIIYQVINQNLKSITIECVGAEQITLKKILQKLLKLIGKKRLLLPLPLLIAKLMCFFTELFPKPLITKDQLKLLRYNNIPSGKFKTNFDLNLPSYANFDLEVEKYCQMWKEAGQFSQIKHKDNN